MKGGHLWGQGDQKGLGLGPNTTSKVVQAKSDRGLLLRRLNEVKLILPLTTGYCPEHMVVPGNAMALPVLASNTKNTE